VTLSVTLSVKLWLTLSVTLSVREFRRFFCQRRLGVV
jgi:hypothetical protein